MTSITKIARGSLATTRLAFGTSRLHYVSRGDRQRLLAAAADIGIKHFDTAPAYGDGLAEGEVGQFIRQRRSEVIIATKYGIPPDPLIAGIPTLGPALRTVRALARRMGYWNYKRPVMTAQALRASTEESLQRLGTNWIDLLLLHDPAIDRIASAETILTELLDLRRRGLIRHFGLGGSWAELSLLIAAVPEIAEVVQTGETEWPADRPPDITYGALVQSPQSAFRKAVDSGIVLERLRVALARRPQGVVLFSTTSTQHLREIVAITPVKLQ
jgi:aryl-alcohol dehydrogenase-like predicted oxidoreductase